MGFVGFVIWCALLAAAGLCVPRRTHGIASLNSFFISLGVASIWFAIGIRQLVRRTA